MPVGNCTNGNRCYPCAMRRLVSMFSLLLLVSCAPPDEVSTDDAGIVGQDADEGGAAQDVGQDASEGGAAQDVGQDATDEPTVAACAYLGGQTCSPTDGFDCCFTSGAAYSYDPTHGCKTSLGDQLLCLKSVHPEGKGCYGEGAMTCYFRDDGETWFVVLAAWGVLEATDASMQRCSFEFAGELEAAA